VAGTELETFKCICDLMHPLQDHPCFIGCYFPGFSSPASIQHCYEAADAIFFVGACLLGSLEASTILLYFVPSAIGLYCMHHQSCFTQPS
jgi:hypothetical protein